MCQRLWKFVLLADVYSNDYSWRYITIFFYNLTYTETIFWNYEKKYILGVYYEEDKTQATIYLIVHGGFVLLTSLIWCIFGFPSNQRVNLVAIGVVIGIFFLLWGTVGIFGKDLCKNQWYIKTSFIFIILFFFSIDSSGKFSNWYEAESPNDKYYCPKGPFLFAFVINITNW